MAVLKAVVRSDCACPAVAPAKNMFPLLTVPGGNPVMDVPGLTPTFPTTAEEPVLVTVEPPKTAKVETVGPRVTPEGPPKESIDQERSAIIFFTAAPFVRCLRSELRLP